jgi:sterol desaturase/sphingolipid hydroxylase (fatty acid hydroxylase superfamily)
MDLQPLLAFCTIFLGYISYNSVLEYLFYFRKSSSRDVNKWKIQNKSIASVGYFWGMPLFSQKPNRGPWHRIVTTMNLGIASMFAFIVTKACCNGNSKMVFTDIFTYGILSVGWDLLLAIIYQSIAEYYWHRLMHTKYFYSLFHKFHHHYKSPEPWDDMYIHPVEAVGYYCILYGPPFLFSIHKIAFLVYMIIMGLCGVMDHSGIGVSVYGLYSTIDHDNHHAKFDVNYGFPFPYMDILHETFDGEFLGKSFSKRTIK